MFNPFGFLVKKKPQAPKINIDKMNSSRSDVLSGTGILPWTFDDGILAYKTCPWVFACIDWLQGAASSVEYTVLQKAKNKEWEVDTESKISYALNNPNKQMSAKIFWGMVILHMYLGGNALVRKVTTVDGVRLFIIPTGGVTYKLDDAHTQIASYEYRWGNAKDDITVYKPEEVVHFMFPNPENIFWGMSPLQAVNKAILCDNKIVKWWETSIQNGCKKDGVFTFKHELNAEQFRKIRQLLRDQVFGPNNAHTPLIMGHEATYTPFDMTPSELDFLASRNFSRQEIASVLKVPLALIAANEDIDGKTLEEYREVFWQDTICPIILDNIVSTLNVQLLPDLVPASKIKSTVIAYNVSGISALLPFLAQQVAVLNQMVLAGIPLNTAIRYLGLGVCYVDGGDVGRVQGAQTPLGMFHEAFNSDQGGDVMAPNGTVRGPSNIPGKPTANVTNNKPKDNNNE